jgi:L-amino acid N-acyltransferase YncA
MNITVRPFEGKDISAMIDIWNEVVSEGNAFPEEELLTKETGLVLFSKQTHCAVAEDASSGKLLGLYIFHPNNIGRCGHIGNAGYAVASANRGLSVGRKLLEDSIVQARRYGFRILQFNAVVATNVSARSLYEKLGFMQVGKIKEGFRMKNGQYEDIYLYYISL